MNPTSPNSLHILDALRSQGTERQQHSVGDFQAALTEQARLILAKHQQQSVMRNDGAFQQSFPSRDEQPSAAQARLMQFSSPTQDCASPGALCSVNIQDVLSSLVNSQAQQQHDSTASIQRLLRMQLEGMSQASTNAVPSTQTDEARLRRILAETASRRQQQQELQSLEDLIRLKKVQQMQHLFMGLIRDAPGPASATQVAATATQHHPAAASTACAASDRLLLPVAQRLLREPQKDLTSQEREAVNSLFGISSLKRKAVDVVQNNQVDIVKKCRTMDKSDVNVTFPLPLLKESDIARNKTSCKLVSFHQSWKELEPLRDARKEFFLRRLHGKKVKLVGGSRSVIFGKEE